MHWQWIASIAATGIIAWILAAYCSAHYGGNRNKLLLIFEVASQAVLIALLLRYGALNVTVLQTILVTMILLVAAWSDIRTREVADYFSVMLLLTAFIGREVTEIPGMLISAVLVAAPAFLVVFACNGRGVGGADIKIIAACGAVLGLNRGWSGMLLGLILAIVINKAIQQIKNTDKSRGFPMVPYLAVGFISAFFI